MRSRALRAARPARHAACSAGACVLLLGCASHTAGPTLGTYTIAFPTTEAAVATDFVQVRVFEVDQANRGGQCDGLMQTQLSAPATLTPSLDPPATNICEMHAGVKPLTLPYGEHTILAVAERRNKDDKSKLDNLLIGCEIMTIGEGDAPVPVALHLVLPNQPLPPSNCATVGDYCGGTCK